MTYEEYLEQSKEALAASKSKSDESINKQAAEQKKVLQENYDYTRNQIERSYDDAYRENAVQKLINEREIEEDMANLGLSDSGLNRTQQTAVQLSYANNRAKLGRQKQSQEDARARELASGLSTVEQNRLSALAENEQLHSQTAVEQATAAYKAEQDALAKAAEESAKATSIIRTNGGLLSRDFVGKLTDNGVDVYQNDDGTYTYVDNNSGKKTTLAEGVNPFTGTTNQDVEYGAFSNGYQPNNVGGKKLSKVKNVEINVDGNTQSVWTADGKYYFWKGRENAYKELTAEERAELGIIPPSVKLMSDWRQKHNFDK